MRINLLSAIAIQKLKPKEKSFRVSDGGNLYFHVRPNGSRTWEFRYKRRHTGKPTILGLGAYPDVSLADARERATAYRKMIGEGIDPKLHKDQQKYVAGKSGASTLRSVAEMWMDAKQGMLKEKTIRDNWRKLEKYAFPLLGEMPVESITAPIAIAALKPYEKQGLLETVKRVGQLLNEIMNYAVNYGLVQHNPLTGIREVFRKPQITHMAALSPEEIYELMRALSIANLQWTTRCLIEWLLHTMVRPNEAAGTRWDEIDLERKLWVIPPERMKMRRSHEVPLTPQVIAILETIRPLTGHCDYVFESSRFANKPTDAETINKALGRIGFKNRTTAHGFRSLASTTLNEQGFDSDVIEAALAHADRNKIRSAYNRTTYLKRRRKMMEWWSDHIEKASHGSLSVAR